MTKASLDIIEIFNVFRDEIKINVSLERVIHASLLLHWIQTNHDASLDEKPWSSQ